MSELELGLAAPNRSSGSNEQRAGRPRSRAFTVAGCLFAVVASSQPVPAQVIVAWNSGTTGKARIMRTRSPWTPRRTAHAVGPHATLGLASHGRFFSLSQSDGTVTLFTAHGRVQRRFELGADRELEDMAAVGRCSAFITRRNAARLLHLDLCTGATRETVDLSEFADADGIPDLGTMALDRGRLFVQIRRYNEDAPGRFAPPADLAVVDVASEQLVDVDSALPGMQAIELAGTSPKHRMQVVDETRRLYVSASGGSFDVGGIEAIDLAGLRSLGLVIREADGMVGADLGPFVLVTPETGYLVYTTDLTLSSHLHRFSVRGDVDPEELNVSVDYAVPALTHDPIAGTLFVPDGVFGRQGLHVFHAATGARLSTDPIPTDGAPTDILLLRRFRTPQP